MPGGSEDCQDVYRSGFLAFLDILGTSSLVRDRSKAPSNWINAILNTIGQVERISLEAGGALGNKSGIASQVRATLFSDSLVITVDCPADEIRRVAADTLLRRVHNACALVTIDSHLLFRGAVVDGLYYHDEGAVFGPALVEAAEAEGRLPEPCVHLNRSVIEALGGAEVVALRSKLQCQDEPSILRHPPLCPEPRHASRYADREDFPFYLDLLRRRSSSFGASKYSPRLREALMRIAEGLLESTDEGLVGKACWIVDSIVADEARDS